MPACTIIEASLMNHVINALMPTCLVSDPAQVTEGTECGLGCDDFLDWAEGDKIECYLVVSKARRLEEAKASTAVDLATLAG